MKIRDMLYALTASRQDLIKLVYVESVPTSFTKDVSKSIDLSVANQSGYTFLTWINPRGLAISGSFYITILNQDQCRIWTVPRETGTGKVAAAAVFVKNEYA